MTASTVKSQRPVNVARGAFRLIRRFDLVPLLALIVAAGILAPILFLTVLPAAIGVFSRRRADEPAAESATATAH